MQCARVVFDCGTLPNKVRQENSQQIRQNNICVSLLVSKLQTYSQHQNTRAPMRGKLSLIKITTRSERIVSPDFYQLKALWPHLTVAKAIFSSSAACLSIPCIPSFSLIVFASTVFVAKHAHHSRYLLQVLSISRNKQVASTNGASHTPGQHFILGSLLQSFTVS